MKRYIYKMLLAFLTVFVISQAGFCKNFKFVQVSDLHYRDDLNSVETLDKIINNINNTKNVEFVVFTGDNTANANKKLYTNFLNQANTLKVPYYVVVGNHDVAKTSGFSKADFINVVRKYNKNQKVKNTNFVVKKGDYIFLVVDGARELIPSFGGYYRDNTLSWIDKKLKKYENKNVIIFQHFPIKITMSEKDTYKNERYEEILAKHTNVKGIFAGHFHTNEEYTKNGIFYSITGQAFGYDGGYKVVNIIEEENPKTHKKEYNFYTQFVQLSDL